MDNPLQNQILDGWQAYQEKLLETIAPLSDAQLSLQLAPGLRSVMTVAAHIIAARVWWFRYVMGEGPVDLEPLQTWDEDGEPFRSAAELADGLERTWAVIAAGLERWTAVDMLQVFPRPGDEQKRSYTRRWIIWHVLEHDLHHGGELSFALGAHGISAIDL